MTKQSNGSAGYRRLIAGLIGGLALSGVAFNAMADDFDGSVVYLEKPDNWSQAYAHVFDAAPGGVFADTQWPGLEMTAVSDGWYRVELSGVDSAGVVFSDNGSPQSDDLPVAGETCYTQNWQNDCSLRPSSDQNHEGTEPETVYLRGTMNGWSTMDPLTWEGGDEFAITLNLSAGDYAFKLANDGWGNQTSAENFVDGGGAVTVSSANDGDSNLTFNASASQEYTMEVDRSNTPHVITLNGEGAEPPPVTELPSVDRNAFVHLFEWSWNDIAHECTNHLGPHGFTAVQVSPPQEHIVGGTWWTRYQPVSYQLESRSGNRSEFINMVNVCADAGVEIYADLIINHTAAIDYETEVNGTSVGGPVGTGGTQWSRMNHPYLYGSGDYHPECIINDYQNRQEVQECQLSGLPDLSTGSDYVQHTLAGYIDDLISIGVTGFRIDAAKHMAASDIEGILNRVNGEAYFFSEVIDLGNEPITSGEYLGFGDVEEFIYSREITRVFKEGSLAWLSEFGEAWAEFQHSGNDVVVFTDNHDNQRGHGAGGQPLTHMDGELYDLGNVYMLAWPYGYPRLMSSYAFTDTELGPPSAPVHGDGAMNCYGDDWQCEHRWRSIANMVTFRAYSDGAPVTDWWDNGANQIAFARENAGFVAINRETSGDLHQAFQTTLPAGEYCNIIASELNDCGGNTVTVNDQGEALIRVPAMGALAIHVGSRLY